VEDRAREQKRSGEKDGRDEKSEREREREGECKTRNVTIGGKSIKHEARGAGGGTGEGDGWKKVREEGKDWRNLKTPGLNSN